MEADLGNKAFASTSNGASIPSDVMAMPGRSKMTMDREPVDMRRVDFSEVAAGRRLPRVHPGAILSDELLKPMQLGISRQARGLNVSRPQLNEIVLGRRAVTTDTTLRLARDCGTTPEFWVNPQARYDLDVAECAPPHKTDREAAPRAVRHLPLLLKLDTLVGLRAKARHREWKHPYQKRIDKLAVCIRNLIDDDHRRVVYDLMQAFDVIFLPRFETGDRSARQERKIGTRAVRSTMGLVHYRFKKNLAWMCREYGKRLVIANEACTSHTRSWDGFVDQEPDGQEQSRAAAPVLSGT